MIPSKSLILDDGLMWEKDNIYKLEYNYFEQIFIFRYSLDLVYVLMCIWGAQEI
jgi:hypothetical protein